MNILNQAVFYSAEVIGFIAAFLIAIGVLHSILYLVWNYKAKSTNNFCSVRVLLGNYMLLSLEFLIGKDILQSILEPTLLELAQLAILVIIRVVLNYFLAMEVDRFTKTVNK